MQLRIVDGWPLHQYPIKNGSAFEVEIDSHKSESETDSMRTLDKIEEE